uniref:Uncharacterized protein n=1 Tax=Arundo donax TaxID=35708 RepID=A0A0A8YGQ7_ARUDO
MSVWFRLVRFVRALFVHV